MVGLVWSGLVGWRGGGRGGGRGGEGSGVPGLAAFSLEIPRSLVMPPGRHQFAPQSLGSTRVCGTEKSGFGVLKGDARTHSPENLDSVGVVWERRRPGPRQSTIACVHFRLGMEQFNHKLIPPFLTEAGDLWGRVASF